VIVASELDNLLDDLFHGCAFAAFLEQAVADRDWPQREQTRQRAYRSYELELAEKSQNGRT
jgi:hypothetical protein